MQKRILLIILGLFLVFSFSACKPEEDDKVKALNQELVRLLPNEGFKWAYFGPSEYYNEMSLISITVDENQSIYKITGEVKDISDGKSKLDHNISIFYEINNDSIIQNKTEEAMLDSEYDSMTIIKAPLVVGTKWSEIVKDKSGKKDTIYGEIIEVTETDEGTKYKVFYKNKSNNYSESRMIMEGYGVTAFAKSVKIDGKKYSYQYTMYGKNSGYPKPDESVESSADDVNLEASVEDTELSDTDNGEGSELAEADNDEGAEPKDTDNDEGAEPKDTDNSTATPESSEITNSVDENQNVIDTIKSFNYAWINYVNENNQEFFNYVSLDGMAYKNAKNFGRTDLTEKFLKMDISSVVVNGNVATAKVYEEIEKTKNGDVTISKYNWLYDLVKKDDKWLVNGYSTQN